MSKIDVLCDLSQTELKEVPARLLDMRNLQMLYLEGNQLEYLPEEFFQKLNRLFWLDLRNNKLKSIPVGIAHHTYLEYLLLESNEIRSLPNELGLLPNLNVLQISYNPLQYPSKEIINQGSEKILMFLKTEYHRVNSIGVHSTKETLSSEEDQRTLISVKKEKISVRQLLKRSVTRLRTKNFPVITVKSLSTEKQTELMKNKEIVSITTPTTRPINKKSCSRQVHKMSRYCSKLHDCKFEKRKAVNSKDGIANQELKDIWLDKLKELLADQEKSLRHERNLKSLSAWRLSKKLESVRTTNLDETTIAPYDTDPHYNKILSRKDLTLAIDVVIRKGKCVPENKNMQQIISEIVCQLKSLEKANIQNFTPRSKVSNIEKEIQVLIDLHKRVISLKSKNEATDVTP